MLLFGFALSPLELIFLTAAAYWVFSALAYALPTPAENASPVYVVIYRLVHFVACNLQKIRGKKPEV